MDLPSDAAFRSQGAAGLTYTTPRNLSLTIEYEYNGAGLDRARWDMLRCGSPATYAQYRAFTSAVHWTHIDSRAAVAAKHRHGHE